MTRTELYWLALELAPSSFEAGQLFFHVTGSPFPDLPRTGRQEVQPEQESLLRELCRRRAAGEPLQYLLGEWEFYGLPFHVGPGVLIPRPDTETLVETALELLPSLGPAPEALDLCAGSGCIAVAVAKEFPRCRMTAVEISDKAFAYLVRNIARNGVGVQAVQADLRDYRHPHPVDLILSNPPYIPREELSGLQAEVCREPVLALDGGPDGLDFYRLLCASSLPQLRERGWICLEVGIHQAQAVAALLERAGCDDIGIRQDLAGVSRVVAGRKRSR